MSRKSRKPKSRVSKSGWAIRLLIAAIVLLLGGAVVGYGLIRSYLHSDGFRAMLSTQVSGALDVEGAFGPLRWDGLAARTTGFEAVGEGPLMAIKAEDVRTEIGLGGIRDGYWLIKGSAARRLEVEFDARTTEDGEVSHELDVDPPDLDEPDPEEEKRGWLPTELRYDTVDVADFSARVILDNGELHLRNHRVRLSDVGGNEALDVDVRGGTIATPLEWLPELRLNEVVGRHQGDSFFLTNAGFGIFSRGALETAGEWHGESGTYAFQGTLRGIQCSDLLDEDWARRVSGNLRGDFTVHDAGSGPVATGSLEMREGVVSALPLLDSLSAYADTRRFREITLHEARCDWEWADGTLTIRNLRLASDGLIRLEGAISIAENGDLDGNFRLGLLPGTLARIPGAERIVFRPGENGLLWAPLRISGNINSPREDLTAQLIAAAGARMFEILPETGERVLRNTGRLLQDLQPDALDRAMDVIGTGSDTGRKIIREAGNVIEGIFGGRDRRRNNGD